METVLLAVVTAAGIGAITFLTVETIRLERQLNKAVASVRAAHGEMYYGSTKRRYEAWCFRMRAWHKEVYRR